MKLSPKASALLTMLRAKAECFETIQGKQWGSVYLDNARPGIHVGAILCGPPKRAQGRRAVSIGRRRLFWSRRNGGERMKKETNMKLLTAKMTRLDKEGAPYHVRNVNAIGFRIEQADVLEHDETELVLRADGCIYHVNLAHLISIELEEL